MSFQDLHDQRCRDIHAQMWAGMERRLWATPEEADAIAAEDEARNPLRPDGRCKKHEIFPVDFGRYHACPECHMGR